MKNQVARRLSDIELIDEQKRIAKELVRSDLSQQKFNENSKLSASAITRRFGSWSKGLKCAGFEEVKMAKRYSEIEYFENLLNVWIHYGRQPYYREMDSLPSKISSGAYERRWGKWSSALLAFIESVNGDKIEEVKEPTAPNVVTKMQVDQ